MIKTVDLGLDISTSVIGICLLEKDIDYPVELEGIKLTSSKLKTMWDKVDAGMDEIKKIVGENKVNRIFVEANLKRFAPGFSSADTICSLAKMNGIISYNCYKHFNIDIIDVGATDARTAIGFKNSRADKRPVKDKVFEFITILHPSFPWKKHIAKTGKSANKEVYNSEMEDACDAYVLCRGGQNIYSC